MGAEAAAMRLWRMSFTSIPSTSTVRSIVGAQKVFVELSSNFSCPSQRSFSCPHAAASRSAPRNNIYSKDLCAEILGKRFPCLITSLLLPSVAFERTGRPCDSLLYPTSEKKKKNLVDNGQERRPTIRLYFLFHPVERGDRYKAQLL